MKELRNKPLPEIPAEIRNQLDASQITLTPFEEMDTILYDSAIQQEVGYRQFANGDWLVSMTCPMPGVTPEMLQWWFWWHPQEKLRYQIWYPGEHFGIRYAKKDRPYFQQETMPPFQPNSQRPVERIGGVKMPLQIDFVTPETFGFTRKAMKENNIPLIVCGHVSAFRGLIKHTEMAHILHRTEDGLTMTSRFWMGKTLNNALLRGKILTDGTARGMAEHCCIEYRNLAEILPGLYQAYCK